MTLKSKGNLRERGLGRNLDFHIFWLSALLAQCGTEEIDSNSDNLLQSWGTKFLWKFFYGVIHQQKDQSWNPRQTPLLGDMCDVISRNINSLKIKIICSKTWLDYCSCHSTSKVCTDWDQSLNEPAQKEFNLAKNSNVTSHTLPTQKFTIVASILTGLFLFFFSFKFSMLERPESALAC